MPLPADQAIRRELLRIIEEIGSQNRTAKLLRLSQASISQFLDGGGLGSKMMVAVLRRSGKTLAELSRSTPVAAEKRNLTPTPEPSSHMRVANRSFEMPAMPPNRARAMELLVAHGEPPDQVDERLALVAIDARLAPCEDRPVPWWLDAYRGSIREEA